jgi:putative component of membrane protein insertase Oxa1/YidC/SpoIIIJ protein YidD
MLRHPGGVRLSMTERWAIYCGGRLYLIRVNRCAPLAQIGVGPDPGGGWGDGRLTMS